VLEVFDHPVIQRCQLHKLRNVCDRLPDAVASTVAKRMRGAYHHADPLVAQAELEALARELDRAHPGAAASLREGLAETLTITRLGVPPTLARTLRSTDESFKAGVALSAGWDGASLLGGRGRPRSQEQGRGAGSPAAQLAP
jgi:transposase-like protein